MQKKEAILRSLSRPSLATKFSLSRRAKFFFYTSASFLFLELYS